jgi:hypothetical protein
MTQQLHAKRRVLANELDEPVAGVELQDLPV